MFYTYIHANVLFKPQMDYFNLIISDPSRLIGTILKNVHTAYVFSSFLKEYGQVLPNDLPS